jgi:hypothetical protein
VRGRNPIAVTVPQFLQYSDVSSKRRVSFARGNQAPYDNPRKSARRLSGRPCICLRVILTRDRDDVVNGFLSTASPFGAKLLGHSEDDEIEFSIDGRTRRVLILRVERPANSDTTTKATVAKTPPVVPEPAAKMANASAAAQRTTAGTPVTISGRLRRGELPGPTLLISHASHRLCVDQIMAAARSPMMTHGAIVLPVATLGMTDPSATRSLSIP